MFGTARPAIRPGRRGAVFYALLWLTFSGFLTVYGQEAFRDSLAGQAAAQAKKIAIANQYYNMKLGPLRLRLTSEMESEFNDNVILTETNRQSDLILRPQIGLATFWPISQENNLSFSVGAGYQKYVENTLSDNFFVSPDSQLSVDIYAGDFLINVHDRFSYSQDVEDQPQISGIGSISRVDNTVGVNTTWDLNKAILNLGYDHETLTVTQPNTAEHDFSADDRSSDLLNAYGLLILNPTVKAGLAANAGIISASTEGGSNKQIGAGPMVQIQMSDYLFLQASLGYAVYFFDATSTNAATDISAVYGDLTLQHRLNAAFKYSLSVGRLLQAGLFSETLELTYVHLNTDWNLFHKFSFSPSFSYEHVTQPTGQSEAADRYIMGAALGRVITQHLNSRLEYDYYLRVSNLAGQSYTQNRLVLDLNYTF